MKLVQLKYFLAVSKYGTFSGAAKDLFISQPAISQTTALQELMPKFTAPFCAMNRIKRNPTPLSPATTAIITAATTLCFTA